MCLCIANSSIISQWVQWEASSCPCWEVVEDRIWKSYLILHVFNWSFLHLRMNTMCTHTVHGLMSEIPVITSTGLRKDILAFAWKMLGVQFTLPGRNAGLIIKEWRHTGLQWDFWALTPSIIKCILLAIIFHQNSPNLLLKINTRVLRASWQQPLSW